MKRFKKARAPVENHLGGSEEMKPGDLRLLQPPIFGMSKAGWTLEGDDVRDLFTASPDDDLADWRDMVIYDSAQHRWQVLEVWRVWPRSAFGLWICRILRDCVHLEVKLSAPEAYSDAELRGQIAAALGEASIRQDAKSVQELLERL